MDKLKRITVELIGKVNDLIVQRKTTELEQLVRKENLSKKEL